MNVYLSFEENKPGKGGEEAENFVFNKYPALGYFACLSSEGCREHRLDRCKTGLNQGRTYCKRDELAVRGQCG